MRRGMGRRAIRERLGLPTPFEEKLPPGLHPPSRLCEAAPKLGTSRRISRVLSPDPLDQQKLRSSSLLVRPENSRRDDLRVVQDEDVARAKKPGKIADEAMAEHARHAVQRHEARGAARRGPLGDRFGRQRDVEIHDVHPVHLAWRLCEPDRLLPPKALCNVRGRSWERLRELTGSSGCSTPPAWGGRSPGWPTNSSRPKAEPTASS